MNLEGICYHLSFQRIRELFQGSCTEVYGFTWAFLPLLPLR